MERPSSIVLQVITILAPSDANSLQAAAPIPLPPPVTITVLSVSYTHLTLPTKA